MRTFATLTSKGRITIPLALRNRLGVKEGDRLEFITEDGQTVIQPSRGEANSFLKFAGILKTFPGGVTEVNAWVAQLRDESDANGD